MERNSLHQMVEKCTYHTLLKEGVLVSSLYVEVPLLEVDRMVTLERRVTTGPGQDQANEEAGATEVLAREVAYLIDGATVYEEPMWVEDENGKQVQIGKSVYCLARHRMREEPTLGILGPSEVLFLGLSKGKNHVE